MTGKPILCYGVDHISDVRSILNRYAIKSSSKIHGFECFVPKSYDHMLSFQDFITFVKNLNLK